jgi:hypothetical protein
MNNVRIKDRTWNMDKFPSFGGAPEGRGGDKENALRAMKNTTLLVLRGKNHRRIFAPENKSNCMKKVEARTYGINRQTDMRMYLCMCMRVVCMPESSMPM